MSERLECEVLQKARYINTLTYLPTCLRLASPPVVVDILEAYKM